MLVPGASKLWVVAAPAAAAAIMPIFSYGIVTNMVTNFPASPSFPDSKWTLRPPGTGASYTMYISYMMINLFVGKINCFFQ